jgi:AraC-like DNA-binding protein
VLSVQRYRRWLFASQSNTTYPELDWLNNILLLSSLLIFLLAITILSENFIHIGPHSFPHLETFYVYISAVIYYLSFKSLRQYKDQGTDERVGQVDTMTAKEDTSYDEQPPFDAGIGEGPGHAENLPVDAEPLLIKEKIIYALETEKLFLNPELNLKDLAKSVGYPSAILSATINKNFGMNFRNLINSYRVEEVKKRIAAGNASHLSLLGIAFECGFNSEASFYRIFRNNTGKSPKDYIHASE